MLTPDDIMDGQRPKGPVLVYDDDHYYMGGVIAELLAKEGFKVALATPESRVSIWTQHTLEQHRIQARLLELGVEIVVTHRLTGIRAGAVSLACTYTGRPHELQAEAVVMVTARLPVDALYQDLAADPKRLAAAGIVTLRRIGDCHGPATISAAVYEGHRFARELGETLPDIPFRRELTGLSGDFRLP